MNSSTITVHWHDESQPVYSVDFQPHSDGLTPSKRLATGGGDNNVRVWRVDYDADTKENTVEYLSTLRKHTQAVNVVRFDPKGEILATAGDDGTLILWTLSDHIVKEFGVDEDEDIKESWVVKRIFRSSTSEIYDLSWSPGLRFIATGAMDNITRIYDVVTGQQVSQLADHSHYVQGVAWDPRNEFLATQSADRSVHIYSLKRNTHNHNQELQLVPTSYFKITRAELPLQKLSSLAEKPVKEIQQFDSFDESTQCTETSTQVSSMSPPSVSSVECIKSPPKKPPASTSSDALPAVRSTSLSSKSFAILKKNSLLYYSETLQSFFRRLAFSPDGSLLLTPSGIFRYEGVLNTPTKSDQTSNEDVTNTVYVYTRGGLNRPPVCHIPGLSKPAIAIAFSPIIYETSDLKDQKPVFKLLYKMIFAVATQDSVLIYDTQSLEPLGHVTNLHYSTITDLCWDTDGQSIIVSSADGFCSRIVFDDGVFGKIYANANCPTNKYWYSTGLGPEKSDEDESSLETKPDTKLDTKPDTKSDAKPDTKPNIKSEDAKSKVSLKSNDKLEPQDDNIQKEKGPKHNILNMLKEADPAHQSFPNAVASVDDTTTPNLDVQEVDGAEPSSTKKKRKVVPTLISK